MKTKLISAGGAILAYLICGAALMLGMRAIEYSVPQPESRVVLCNAFEPERDAPADVTCRTVREWINEKRAQQ